MLRRKSLIPYMNVLPVYKLLSTSAPNKPSLYINTKWTRTIEYNSKSTVAYLCYGTLFIGTNIVLSKQIKTMNKNNHSYFHNSFYVLLFILSKVKVVRTSRSIYLRICKHNICKQKFWENTQTLREWNGVVICNRLTWEENGK